MNSPCFVRNIKRTKNLIEQIHITQIHITTALSVTFLKYYYKNRLLIFQFNLFFNGFKAINVSALCFTVHSYFISRLSNSVGSVKTFTQVDSWIHNTSYSCIYFWCRGQGYQLYFLEDYTINYEKSYFDMNSRKQNCTHWNFNKNM